MAASRRGKYGHYNVGAAMSFSEIGETLHMPATTAFSLFKRGLAKLRRTPGALEGLLECVQAVADGDGELLRAGSLECRKDWIDLHAPGADNA
ncbi:MAG TPA: hypothetical protein VMQ76_06955 [Terracidiphilus sp.]|jgi:hypothetical protein|nr:hypothetical protein [Terracidiphilus sp.]